MTKSEFWKLISVIVVIALVVTFVEIRFPFSKQDDGAAQLGMTNLTALTLDETLDVTGATSLGDTLDVTGATSLGDALDVTGATSLSSTLNVTDTSTFDGEFIFTKQEITPTTGSTLTPTATFYIINTSGAVTITLGTTGAVAGQLLILYGKDANNVTIADTDILTTTGNALVIGQYDIAVFVYNGTAWVELLLATDS